MLNLWQSLNWPQALVVIAALAGLLFGAVLAIVSCATHLAETILTAILALIAAAWSRFTQYAAQITRQVNEHWERVAKEKRPWWFRSRPFTPEERELDRQIRGEAGQDAA